MPLAEDKPVPARVDPGFNYSLSRAHVSGYRTRKMGQSQYMNPFYHANTPGGQLHRQAWLAGWNERDREEKPCPPDL